MEHFMRGINLGGWLSQYAEYDHEHFRTFITEPDIARIAGWGLDHVRIPVDYPVIEEPDSPGTVREAGYEYIDAALGWCKQHGLAAVLDIHEAPGFTFRNDLEAETGHLNRLFEDAAVQDRFVALWREVARRYVEAPVPVIFELLNEVTTPTNDEWNKLAARTVAAIREIAPTTPIMIGGNVNNGIPGLKGLVEIPDDPNIVYTVHTYEPLLFTHQSAPWDAKTRTWGQKGVVPGRVTPRRGVHQGAPGLGGGVRRRRRPPPRQGLHGGGLRRPRWHSPSARGGSSTAASSASPTGSSPPAAPGGCGTC